MKLNMLACILAGFVLGAGAGLRLSATGNCLVWESEIPPRDQLTHWDSRWSGTSSIAMPSTETGKKDTGFVEVHSPLTAQEKERWRHIQAVMADVFHMEGVAEAQIIAAHGLKEDHYCGEQLDIRGDEDFIFDAVPDNPLWPTRECGEKLKAVREAGKSITYWQACSNKNRQ